MVAVLAIIALIVVANQLSVPPAPAAAPVAPAAAAELVVVLPSADGHTGTVVVDSRGERTILNQPYAANRMGRNSGPTRLSEQEVKSAFGAALGSIPARPASFLLYFVTGTDQLTEESGAELERMLMELRRRPAPDILVIGHTDTVGGDADNDRLSLLRAERVRASLVAQGIAPGRIHASGRGEREPIVQTGDGVDEPRNRRVEINVR
ncbi:MAG TPA: OmpA family protein [Burkholderiales bacterium]|jgi:outer membrane protein OmpA-like peptidoglycan-associated protein|nr:OmpA family protein [Burkholderiales bacterium]